MTDQTEIEKAVLQSAIEVVRKGEGALFVIGSAEYETLLKQKFLEFSVFDPGAEKTLVGLAIVDGAVIIDTEGNVKEYGALIKNTVPFVGFGTRHAAAVTASRTATVILCSEEDRKVKVFKEGSLVLQLDALEKGIEKRVPEVVGLFHNPHVGTILESIGAGVISTAAVSVLAPAVGIMFVPGVIVFSGGYWAIKKLIGKK